MTPRFEQLIRFSVTVLDSVPSFGDGLKSARCDRPQCGQKMQVDGDAAGWTVGAITGFGHLGLPTDGIGYVLTRPNPFAYEGSWPGAREGVAIQEG